MKKKLTGVALVLAAVSLMGIQPAGACTRAVYLGPDRMVVTGRTMDWKEDIMSISMCFHVECSVRDTIKKKQ